MLNAVTEGKEYEKVYRAPDNGEEVVRRPLGRSDKNGVPFLTYARKDASDGGDSNYAKRRQKIFHIVAHTIMICNFSRKYKEMTQFTAKKYILSVKALKDVIYYLNFMPVEFFLNIFNIVGGKRCYYGFAV